MKSLILSALILCQSCFGINYLNTNSVGGDSGQKGGAKINANFWELWATGVTLSNLIAQTKTSLTNVDLATSNALHTIMLSESNALALRIINTSNAIWLEMQDIRLDTVPSNAATPLKIYGAGSVIVTSNANIYTAQLASNSTVSGSVAVAGTVFPTNGVALQTKSSFFTNFTAIPSIQVYCCNGTNQLITLPDCTNTTPYIIYRFACTNKYGSFTLTNANGVQTIRDGLSLSFKQVGIGSPSFFHDGAAWWPAARTKIVMPSASWSTTTNIPLTSVVASNIITYDTPEFNNSQGIALVNGSDIYATNAGDYLLTYSAMCNAGHNNDWMSIWLVKDGTNVARTRTDVCFSTTAVTNCVTVNYFVSVGSVPSYFRLVGRALSTGNAIVGAAATATNGPAAPSIIVTINRISDPYP